jgi:hypothetical protein
MHVMTVPPEGGGPVIERKVSAAGLGALIAGALIWALQTWVFKGAVPGILSQLIDWLAPILGALIFGYLAPHTPRPDLEEPQQQAKAA